MKLGLAGGVLVVLAIVAVILGYSALFTVPQLSRRLSSAQRPPIGAPTPGRACIQDAAHRQRHLYRQAILISNVVRQRRIVVAWTNRFHVGSERLCRAFARSASTMRCCSIRRSVHSMRPIHSCRSCSTRPYARGAKDVVHVV